MHRLNGSWLKTAPMLDLKQAIQVLGTVQKILGALGKPGV